MPNLSQRSYAEEVMDDLNDDSDNLYQALHELDVINKWLGGNEITVNAVLDIIKRNPNKHWHIADIGCGSGNMLKLIALEAKKLSIQVDFEGIDANPNVVNYAKKHCKDFPEIKFTSLNIFDDSFQEKNYDIMLSTLFLHHFDEQQLVKILTQLKRSARYLVINDLHRHWFAYYSIKLITYLFSKSDMVKNDACLSVWRSFRKKEIIEILKKADIHSYMLHWKWAFRWKIVCS